MHIFFQYEVCIHFAGGAPCLRDENYMNDGRMNPQSEGLQDFAMGWMESAYHRLYLMPGLGFGHP